MASVRKRTMPNGSTAYQVQWHIVVNGQRKQRTKLFTRSAEAKKYASEMTEEVEQRRIFDKNDFTVAGYLEYWLDHHPRQLSITTMLGYRRLVAMLNRQVGDIRLNKLSSRDLDAAYRALLQSGGVARTKDKSPKPLTTRSVLHVHRCAHVAFRQAVKWEMIPSNPATNATAPTPKKSRTRSLDKDERQAIWTAVKSSNYPGLDRLMATLTMTGLRRSELLGLAFDCIDFKARTLTVRRTVVSGEHNEAVMRDHTAKSEDSLRTVHMSDQLVAILERQRAFIAEEMLKFGRDYQRDPLLVFPEVGGHVTKPDSLSTRLRLVNKKAGVRAAPVHSHRHTAATVMLSKGADIKTIQTALGHSRPEITLALYCHSETEREQAAAAMLGDVYEA
jgi:integrase